MKKILLTGKSLELARGFAERADAYLETRKKLDAQIKEIQRAAEKDMLDTVEAVKKEMGIAKDEILQIDADYLKECGHAYARIHKPRNTAFVLDPSGGMQEVNLDEEEDEDDEEDADSNLTDLPSEKPN